MTLQPKTSLLPILWLLATVACVTPFAPAATTATPPASATLTELGQAATPALTPAADATPTAPAAGGLVAQALSPVSVALEWPPVSDASAYHLDARYGDGDPFSVADLPADQTTYVHFVVPGSPSLTYQLSALTAAGQTAIAGAEVTLPPLEPQPVLVEQLSAATNTAAAAPTPVPLPTIDPLNPDPDALATLTAFATGLDPDAPAPTAPPAGVQQAIGPEGGTITLTAPNAAQFTLQVPPGAVAELTTFYLTPIEAVSAFPFAGGPLAAVQIHPPIQFGVPLTLTILPAAAASADVIVGFTVSSFNHELALAPRYPAGARAYQLTVYWGDTFGLAAATLDEIQAQVSRIPSDPGEQIDQQLAALRAFNPDPSPEAAAQLWTQILAGLVQQVAALPASASGRPPAGLAAPARRPLPSAAGQRLWNSINLSDRFLSNERVGDTPIDITPMNQARQQAILEALAGQIKPFLDAHQGCRAGDDYYARAIVRMLKAPATSFQRRLAANYTGRFGPPPGEVECAYQLHILRSKIVIEAGDAEAGLTLTLVVHANPFTLVPVTRGDRPALRGDGPVTYEVYNYDFTHCPHPFDVVPPPAAVIWIVDLQPLFDADDRVSNFALRGVMPDPMASGANLGSIITDKDDAGQCTIVGFKPQDPHPDTWGQTFPGLHNPIVNIDSWTIVGDQSYVATSSVTNWLQGRITESTEMILTVNQISP